MFEPETFPAAEALKDQDLRALRGRALQYCQGVEGTVASAELAREVFRRDRGRQLTDPILLRALLRGDARFIEREEGWRLARRQPADLPLEEARFAVVDLEATGSNPARESLLEVGISWIEGLEIVGEYQQLVNPERAIPPWIRRLTGIDSAMVADEPPFGDIAPELELALRGSIFVAHNVDFDYPFLRAQLRAAGREPGPWPRLCTLKMARRHLPGLDSYRLESLAKARGIALPDHHRAHSDAHATAHLFLDMVHQLREEKGIRTTHELLAAHPRH